MTNPTNHPCPYIAARGDRYRLAAVLAAVEWRSGRPVADAPDFFARRAGRLAGV